MGCNYYLHKDCCEQCGRSGDEIHIGKSSAGWCFSLHVTDEIKNLDDWKAEWAIPGGVIKDEYGETLTTEEMLEVITNRVWRERWDDPVGIGYNSWEQFHSQNKSEPGPNGLLRHRVGITYGYGCLAQGDGTYDLMVGEFS